MSKGILLITEEGGSSGILIVAGPRGEGFIFKSKQALSSVIVIVGVPPEADSFLNPLILLAFGRNFRSVRLF